MPISPIPQACPRGTDGGGADREAAASPALAAVQVTSGAPSWLGQQGGNVAWGPVAGCQSWPGGRDGPVQTRPAHLRLGRSRGPGGCRSAAGIATSSHHQPPYSVWGRPRALPAVSVPCHATSRHVTSPRCATSRYVTTLRHVTPRHVTTLRHAAQRHVASRHITLRHVTLCNTTSRHVTSRRATPRRATSRHHAAPHRAA